MAKKCGHCKYRCKVSFGICCQYILVTGHMRGCDPDNCDKFVNGKMVVLPADHLEDFQRKQWEYLKRKRLQDEQNNINGSINQNTGGSILSGSNSDRNSEISACG